MSETIPVRTIETPPKKKHDAGRIHPRSFRGFYRRLRIAGGSALFALFFGTVWLQWGDRQAVLWDLSTKQFHVFGSSFWPQDLLLLSAILMICAFGLFFMTVWAGRIWCGYTCPQSVWMWLFMWVEKQAEGDRNQRIKLDRSPATLSKLYKRAKKHGGWLLISLVTAVTFVGYFTPIRALVPDLLQLKADASAAFWVMAFTTATYINAGWLREKVCVHMCPYGRFQSSMLDSDSLVISYDVARGEPRGHRKPGADYHSAGLGDCVDCQMCVQVCPTGIDIREGLQIDCIGCAACIDACDTVMDKLGYETGLIRYASERELAGGRRRILRPRLVGYGAVLIVMVALLAWAIATRSLVSLDVEKDRSLYRFNHQGQIENSYVVSVLNKSHQDRTFRLHVRGLDGLHLVNAAPFVVGGGERVAVPVAVAVSPEALPSDVLDVEFELEALGGSSRTWQETTRFTGETQSPR
ncbi:cytochrome c oxidase accessory protein CcoG [Tamilnaduibacter salinus]|uniref:Cytochrome c oxidase accessory protein CcoG n=1 Tax=Tamilnaduibacter salinus TaxID=1484056 RepID=A0A2A2I0M6_9GAMM|nr:cytochrome c oxidase accessory protein CcoG [Tamilnaduibacter salinus]PAV24856.1 cytochrome c oxidase accessory protein CcoG [Tamilnaduibacter salinus]